MNKKAVFFTLLSLLVLSIVIALFSPLQNVRDTAQPTSLRIDAVSTFVDNLRVSFLPLSMQAATSHAITYTVQDMNESNYFLRNPGRDLGRVATHGWYNETLITTNSTLNNFTQSMQEQAQRALNLELSIATLSFHLNQSTPWELDIWGIFNINATSETAQWEQQNISVHTTLSIIGYDDPVYLVNGTGAYRKRIAQSNISEQDWYPDFVNQLIRNETYVHFEDSTAPSYLSRFNRSSDESRCCGIFSVVNPSKLTQPNHNESYVDYLFFNNSIGCSRLFQATGLDAPFTQAKFNFDYLIRLNLTSASDQLTC